MPIIEACKQREEIWFMLRAGNPGTSSFDKIITTKGEPSKSAKDYMMQLAGELITGKSEEQFQSVHMSNGTLREPEARDTFRFITDIEIEEVGLVWKDERKLFHSSPDGINTNLCTGLEIKSPKMVTHLKYLIDGKLPTEYIQQVQGSMYVCEYETWHFMSYYPGLQPLIITVHRDEKFVKQLEKTLEDFTGELALLVRKLKSL